MKKRPTDIQLSSGSLRRVSIVGHHNPRQHLVEGDEATGNILSVTAARRGEQD